MEIHNSNVNLKKLIDEYNIKGEGKYTLIVLFELILAINAEAPSLLFLVAYFVG